MKSNRKYEWRVILRGRGSRSLVHWFAGTVEEVLHKADELECEVDWLVLRFEIERGKRR